MSYQGQPTPAGTVSRIKGLSTAILVLVVLSAVGTALVTLITPSAEDDAVDFLDGRISEDDFIESYAPVLLAQAVQSIALLASAVVSVIWLYRIAKNVRLFGRATTWAPIWAVFGWVLPPFVYIIPTLMLREMWQASDPETPAGSDSWKQQRTPPILWTWVAVYVVGPLILLGFQAGSLVGGGFAGDTESLAEQVDDFGAAQYASGILGVVGAVVWIVLTRQYTQRHMRLTGER